MPRRSPVAAPFPPAASRSLGIARLRHLLVTWDCPRTRDGLTRESLFAPSLYDWASTEPNPASLCTRYGFGSEASLADKQQQQCLLSALMEAAGNLGM